MKCKCDSKQICFKCSNDDKNGFFWDLTLDTNSVLYWYSDTGNISLDKRNFYGMMLKN